MHWPLSIDVHHACFLFPVCNRVLFVCVDSVAYSLLHSLLRGVFEMCFMCLTLLSFSSVPGFRVRFAVGLLLLLFVPVLIRLVSFDSMRSCTGLLYLFLDSGVTIVFVGGTCDERSGNKQMVHSQFAVVIAFSLF